MRAALLALLLCAACASFTIERTDMRMSGILVGQAAVTSCQANGVTKAMTTATAAGPPDDHVTASASEGIDTSVTGPCDRVEGGPMSPATMATFAAAFAALVAIAAVASF